jgi:hypothetical protein
MINDSLNLKGRVALELKDAEGNVKEVREIDNLVVDAGLDYIASRMEGTTLDAMSHMGLGSGSTAADAADTDLETLLGSREALDSTTVTDNQVVYVATFEAGDATGSVREAGIFNAATSGTMLCRTVFDVVNKAADDTLSVTWTITISAS